MKPISVAFLVLFVCFVPAALGQKVTCPTTVDWTEYHGINMQRWNPCEMVLGVQNVGSLQLKWSYATGGYVTYSPVVVQGVAYFGSADNNVYAVGANTGALLWSYTTGNAVNSSPAVANGVVYAGSTDGSLYALDAGTGALLWSYATSTAVGSPAVAYGLVFFGGYLGLYAANARTGELRWSYSCGGTPAPAVLNGIVYTAGCLAFEAVNAGTGIEVWAQYSEYLGGMTNGPAVGHGIYFGTGTYGKFDAFDANTGADVWGMSTPHTTVNGSAAVANGVVYLGSSGSNYRGQSLAAVWALDASTGAQRWEDMPGADVNGAPAVANGVVYIGTAVGTGTEYALSAKNGAVLWTAPGHADSSPTVVNGMVYFSSGDSSVDAYGLP